MYPAHLRILPVYLELHSGRIAGTMQLLILF